jgi:hypothetical protein
MLIVTVLVASAINATLLTGANTFTGLIGTAQAAEPTADCEHSQLRVGECLEIHGRLSVYNGGGLFRIWPVGTHRLLAVVGADGSCCDDKALLRPQIDKLMSTAPWTTWICANWRVCPITRQALGVMQHVCIQRAEHPVVQRLPE